MKWLKNVILGWLTQPEVETMQQKNEKFLETVKKDPNDIKYTDDPVTPGFIHVSELSDMTFDEDVVMFLIGKKQSKWLYYARYKHNKRGETGTH